MKLQSILYPSGAICDEEALYLHRDGSFILFDGYFNLFYLEKHHKYCDIGELSLELTVRGVKCLQIMHDRDVVSEMEITVPPQSGMDRIRGRIPSLQDERRISFKLPYDEYDKGVLWLKAEVEDKEKGWDIKGFFEGELKGETDSFSKNESENIEIAVNICTFRREKYVARNMKSLSEWKSCVDIDGNAPEAASHMHVFLIDNGKSLGDSEEFGSAAKALLGSGEHSDFLRVIPNDNTGGCGGFSRGMLEAITLRQELSITHLLMMDDDAVFEPDMFVRLYGFLSMLRPEYREITVGGELMREDYPYVQHAAGEWFSNFKVINEQLLVDMRSFDNCISEGATRTDKEHDMYGAWWCCCYHMNAITRENIPLPQFVHHDDIQFGMKQAGRGIVFLNGIGVWHQGFELVFPGVKQYYNMRNTLITMSLFEPEQLLHRLKWWTVRRYTGMLISYRYADCEFVYRGLMDFLEGKKWLLDSRPEELHKELMETYRSMCPMGDVELLLKESGASGYSDGHSSIIEEIQGFSARLTTEQLRNYYNSDRFKGSLGKKITINGWFLPGKKGLKLITPLNNPWDVYRYKKVLLYEPATGKGSFAVRDNKEFFKAVFRLLKMCIAIDRRGRTATESYRG